ncbi:hypothetical protein [Microbispora sp. NPDC046933]|uniref:hypothetical protein n=1 Tax=Microbispora sp. NPDC046933 TaxID=3155618 RepID=UPI0033D51E9D
MQRVPVTLLLIAILAQGGAYATGVLALILSVAVAVAGGGWRVAGGVWRWPSRSTPPRKAGEGVIAFGVISAALL